MDNQERQNADQAMESADQVKERKREYFRNWRKNNPDKVRAAQERYWLRKANAGESKSYQTR